MKSMEILVSQGKSRVPARVEALQPGQWSLWCSTATVTQSTVVVKIGDKQHSLPVFWSCTYAAHSSYTGATLVQTCILCFKHFVYSCISYLGTTHTVWHTRVMSAFYTHAGSTKLELLLTNNNNRNTTTNYYPVQLSTSFKGRSHSVRRWTHLSELMMSCRTGRIKSIGFSKRTTTFLCWRTSAVSERLPTKFSLAINYISTVT